MSNRAIFDDSGFNNPDQYDSNLSFARNDNSVLGRWWWAVDRWLLLAIAVLIGIGILMNLAAAPTSAARTQQLMLVPVAILIMFVTSLIPVVTLRRLCLLGIVVALIGLVLVLLFGTEAKGASRWLNVMGFSLQPSEFVKPLFAVTCAWALATQHDFSEFKGRGVATGLYLVTITLLILEPDFGQAFLISCIWAACMFLAGIPFLWFLIMGILAALMFATAYTFLPHVQRRIHDFWFPTEKTDTYQISKSLEAFRDGGLFGKGPGEGSIKHHLPDSHADFIFAVVGEEFGLIACLLILMVVVFILLRLFRAALRHPDLFLALAIAGVATQMAAQSAINMATSLALIPTKGMTLPFVSHGGSSLLASSFMMGLMLAFTQKR